MGKQKEFSSQDDFDEEFSGIASHINGLDQLDLIERAADDFRLEKAARFMTAGEAYFIFNTGGYIEVLAQVRADYCLSPEEVAVAYGLVEDRLIHGRASA